MAVLGVVAREENLSTQVYALLKRALMTGSYQPGDKVTIRAIAEEAQVSFTPAREAVARLIVEGGLENAGPKTVVVPVLNTETLMEITAIRKALECMVVTIGAERLTAKDLGKLRGIQDRLEQAMDSESYRDVLRYNEEFHFHIYRLSGYQHALQMIEACWARIGPSLNLLYPAFSISREGVSNHRSLIKAVESGHPADSARFIQADIEGGFALLSHIVE